MTTVLKAGRASRTVLGGLTLALALAACTGPAGEADPTEAPEEVPQRTAEASPGAEGETASDAGASMGPATGSGAAGLTVAAEGEGPMGLTAASPVEETEGEAAEVSGRLVVGPGACLSVVSDGAGDEQRPRLAVFPEGTEFVLRGDRPSVTADPLGTVQVGEHTTFTAVEVPLDEADGVPERCARGAADSVLAVQGR
ncbi:hypothetical protein [Brevibacterium salitolerans]|uniref:Lipoprotein n=1 Tax=Brevibacterium salitolerans TaxID=1403566 RepID=A0ABP5HYB9_9MICO